MSCPHEKETIEQRVDTTPARGRKKGENPMGHYVKRISLRLFAVSCVASLLVCLLASSPPVSAHGPGTDSALSTPVRSAPSGRSDLKMEEGAWFQLFHFGSRLPSPDARIIAQQQADGLPQPGISSAWVPLGPQPLNSLASWGLASGRITAEAVNPTNSNDVWVGAADGGLWHSTDGGAHWHPMTDSQSTLSVGSIAIDPKHPNTIYVGT